MSRDFFACLKLFAVKNACMGFEAIVEDAQCLVEYLA